MEWPSRRSRLLVRTKIPQSKTRARASHGASRRASAEAEGNRDGSAAVGWGTTSRCPTTSARACGRERPRRIATGSASDRRRSTRTARDGVSGNSPITMGCALSRLSRAARTTSEPATSAASRSSRNGGSSRERSGSRSPLMWEAASSSSWVVASSSARRWSASSCSHPRHPSSVRTIPRARASVRARRRGGARDVEVKVCTAAPVGWPVMRVCVVEDVGGRDASSARPSRRAPPGQA